jgi:iron complex outermembrane receptor protein
MINSRSRRASQTRRFKPQHTLLAASLQAVLYALTLSASAAPQAGVAQTSPAPAASITFAIAAGPLDAALERFARSTGVNLSYDAALLNGASTRGLNGNYSVAAGLALLLTGSGLEAVAQNGGYALKKQAASADGAAVLPTITVKAAAAPSDLPQPYAGGQTARGARLGLLGNRDLIDTPFAVTSYTSELIENQQARTVGEVLENDPSVRDTTSSGHIYENFRLRGFDVNSQDLALNGMFGLTPYGHVPTEFIERVEVLRGPSALFTGMSPSGGIGGVINVVPKRAGDTPLTQVTVDYVSDSQFGTHLDLGRRFGQDNRFGVRFNGSFQDGDTELDGQQKKRVFASVGLDYRGDAFNLSLDAYQSDESYTGGTPAMFSFSSTTLPAAANATVNQFKGLYGDMHNSAVVVRGDADLNEHLNAYAALGALQNDYSGFLNGTHARNVDAAGNYSAYTTSQRGYYDSLSSEAGLRGSAHTGDIGHQWVLNATSLQLENGSVTKAGATYTSNIYNPATPVIAGDPGAAVKTGATTLTSLALVDTLSFAGDKVQLTLGARHQHIESKSYSASTGALTANYDQSALTPAAALLLKPWGPGLSLYANYVEGLSKGGTVTDTTASNYQQTFAPFKTKQKEMGLKWDAGSFSHSASLFQITLPSMIKSGTAYTDDGEQRNRGLEWNVSGEMARNLRLLGGVAYTQGRLTKTASGTYDGKTPIGTPDWQSNLGLEWDVGAGLTLNARAVYTSSQYINSANTQQIPAWTRYDAGARYNMRLLERKVVWRANVINLAGKNYWSGSFSDGYATLGAARTVSLSATVDF